MKLLVTGGAGYIGSHSLLEFLDVGMDVVVLDNLSNSSEKAVDAIRSLASRDFEFVEGDILDARQLDRVFETHQPSAVVHFAGLKAVGESVDQPLRYYRNNVAGTISLLDCMRAHDVKTIVFSSSATVYGDPASVPITEDFPTSATNPYGRSKLIVEQMLRDLYRSDSSWSISLLRYFNPVGAHESGEIGEDPNGPPNNLMPYICQVAVGTLPRLSVFGDDYATPDGTGVRDYIHVVDLAKGHVKALEHLEGGPRLAVHNLGTGCGYSVLEVVRAFERASGREIPYDIVARRPGDVAECYANPTLAGSELNWRAQHGLDRMCEDAWRWQAAHPNGFAE
jgi:UDP-glucose 4-epimerase